jgi:hypothetical protein
MLSLPCAACAPGHCSAMPVRAAHGAATGMCPGVWGVQDVSVNLCERCVACFPWCETRCEIPLCRAWGFGAACTPCHAVCVSCSVCEEQLLKHIWPCRARQSRLAACLAGALPLVLNLALRSQEANSMKYAVRPERRRGHALELRAATGAAINILTRCSAAA